MSEEDLDQRVLKFVRRARSVTAAEVAHSLDVSRSDANSSLYRGIGRLFRKSDDQPPRWSLLDGDRASISTGPLRAVPLFARQDFHVDFAGGDWRLRIAVADGSRNEPIARVEILGERHRLITVASYACGRINGNVLPAAAVGIASSVLAWEIHQSLRARGIEAFHFEEAVRDIFLSLTWQAAKLHEGADNEGTSA